jgi:parallel beta-helix repeat protein
MDKLRDALFTVITSFFVIATASATTYYVDPTIGDDNRSGTATSLGANSAGPWRTLGRASTAALAAGDSVLLKCGQIWHESLEFQSSGTATLPIKVGSYPTNCSNPPIIDGSTNIPEHSWTRHSGNIFKTSLSLNEVPNGDFRTALNGWRSWSSSNTAALSLLNTCPSTGSGCARFYSGSSTSGNLAISPRFSIQNVTYNLRFKLKAATGKTILATVRRDASPWDAIGFSQVISGTGGWTEHSFSFQSKAEISNARLDFSTGPNTTIEIDDVLIEKLAATPIALYAHGLNTAEARHPNPGHDITNPTNPYALAATDSDSIPAGDRTGSSYLVVGGDLRLPAGASIPVGGEIIVRTNAWMIESRAINSVNNTRINFTSVTNFPIKSGWGYYLQGALWMVDSPGEWYFDHSTRNLYFYPPNGDVSGSDVSIGTQNVGIDLSTRTGIIVEGIAIRRTNIGIEADSASNISITSVDVSDIHLDGLQAQRSTALRIADSTFERIGRDAISGIDPIVGGPSRALVVENNLISNSGVTIIEGAITSAPVKSHAAIRTGENATVRNNTILHSGYIGIWPMKGSLIEGNLVERSCIILDDCGGIYVNRDQTGTIIRDNLVLEVDGALHGKPSKFSQGQGIYLDDHTVNAIVESNVVIGADHGIQLHNAAQNRISTNTLFANRRYQLWLQEKANFVRAAGDVYGNTVQSNVFVPKDTSPAVYQESLFSSTTAFATYDYNRYSSLLSPQIALEQWTGGVANYTLPQWKAAVAGGNSRRLDSNGTQATLGAAAAFRVFGSNLVGNGKLGNGLLGWAAWNATAPFGTLSLDECSGIQCLRYVAGASAGLVYTSNFSVNKDQWYRLSFDLKTGTEGQPVLVGTRRGGGGLNGYEWLMSSPQTLSGSTGWKRHVITFKATKSVLANDLATGDLGARVDFQVKTSGHTIWVKHLELVSLTAVGSSLEFLPLINRSASPTSFDCPYRLTAPARCIGYFKVVSGAAVTWPIPVQGRHAEIVYSRGDTLVDTDADGIGDAQDSCSNSPSASVDSNGCGIGQ